MLLVGQLLDDLLRQLPALRAESHDAVVGDAAVDGVERGGDYVDAQDHAGTAAVRLVVDLAGAERRRIAVVEKPQVELGTQHRRERTLLGHPREGVRDEREDVDPHSANPCATTTRPASRSTSRTQSATIGRARPSSSSSTSLAG